MNSPENFTVKDGMNYINDLLAENAKLLEMLAAARPAMSPPTELHEMAKTVIDRLKRDNAKLEEIIALKEIALNNNDRAIAQLSDKLAAAQADTRRLDWLERFLQIGGTSVSSQPTCQAHENREDDTPQTTWNHPFSIGYQVETEHRGCYSWRELSNGTKSLRLAVDAAQAKHAAMQEAAL